MRRPLANALDLDLAGGLTDQVTPQAGSALLIEVMRRSGVITAAERHLPAEQSTKGLRQGELVEAFVLLSALGGECLDDFDTLRRDRGLAALSRKGSCRRGTGFRASCCWRSPVREP
jgi:hypothetical protein